MIIEAFANVGFWIIEKIFTALQVVTLPFDLISVLFDFLKFGAWVMGGDLVAIVFACIFAWLSFKFTSGLVLFLYRLIPLT